MKILLGVCGGIAAYKAAEVLRELQRGSATVHVMMTAAAQQFVTATTFAALSGHAVMTSLWQPTDTGERFDIEHIAASLDADAIVLAPATANTLAKLAHGFADDAVSATILAATCPVLVAPAMNVNMWHHPATQANLATLRTRGVLVIEPASGELACGMVGEGRLAEPIQIAAAVFAAVQRSTQDLVGERILITSGGTREPFDAVRFLGNRSSGRMGLALAEEALARGAEVVYITAAKEAPASPRCSVARVETAAEMHSAALLALAQATAVYMAAAVSDYRVEQPAEHKLKKQPRLTLELTPNPDILRDLCNRRGSNTTIIGFAAETGPLLSEARRKLASKGADAIFANDVSSPDAGFEVDRNGGVLVTRGAEQVLAHATKREIARQLLDALPAIRRDAAEWWAHQDSNLEPRDYESPALTD